MKLWLKDLLTKRIEKTKSERYHPDIYMLGRGLYSSIGYLTDEEVQSLARYIANYVMEEQSRNKKVALDTDLFAHAIHTYAKRVQVDLRGDNK